MARSMSRSSVDGSGQSRPEASAAIAQVSRARRNGDVTMT
jgi:hypothetical protein